MTGENFVSLTGTIQYPTLKNVGQNNSSLFNGKLAIPTNGGSNQYIKITAWASIAEEMYEVPEKIFVKIHGHIEERSYDGKCHHCGGFDKRWWTNVIVDNFIVLEEE